MSKLAIVAAQEREVHPLIKRWKKTQTTHTIYEHATTILICGGIGATAARRATEAVITLYAPSLVISAGFAGALDPTLKVGEILEPRHIVNFADASRIQTESTENKILITYPTIATPAQKSTLRNSYSAAAVDMEAAAVARAAEVRGIPFAAVKIISDEVDFEIPDMSAFVDPTGKFREARFALHAALRPWLWPRLMQLASNSNRASRALCARLEQIIANHTAHQQIAPPRSPTNH